MLPKTRARAYRDGYRRGGQLVQESHLPTCPCTIPTMEGGEMEGRETHFKFRGETSSSGLAADVAPVCHSRQLQLKGKDEKMARNCGYRPDRDRITMRGECCWKGECSR
jgi:hypothetical protein